MSAPDQDWQVTASQWEDLINLSAFQMIHGPLNGFLRFRYLRFGTPETEPVPAGLDFSKPFPLPIWCRVSTPDEVDEAQP